MSLVERNVEGMHIKKIRNLLLHFPVVLMCSWMMVKRGENPFESFILWIVRTKADMETDG